MYSSGPVLPILFILSVIVCELNVAPSIFVWIWSSKFVVCPGNVLAVYCANAFLELTSTKSRTNQLSFE